MRDALLLFAEEKSESEGERVSLGRGIKINRNTSSEDRYRNRVIRPSLSFRGGKKSEKKTKTKRKLPIDQAKDDDVNKNDAKTYLGRKASER